MVPTVELFSPIQTSESLGHTMGIFQWMLTNGMLRVQSAVSRYKNSKQNTKVKNHISVREEGRS